MKVIIDTGPVIALAKVRHIFLIQSLFDKVIMPQAVYKELMANVGDEGKAIDHAINSFIKIEEVKTENAEQIEPRMHNLGIGEQEVIMLAMRIKEETLLILDDKAARSFVKHLDISFTGIVGLILMAKDKGLIKEAFEILSKIRDQGYWLSDKMLQEAKQMAGA